MLSPCGYRAPATKTKATAVSSYKQGDPPPDRWIDVYSLAEPASAHPFESQRRAAAIDMMLQDTKLPAPPVAVKPAPAAPPVAVKPPPPTTAAPVAVKPAPAAAPVAVKSAPAAAAAPPPPPGVETKLKRRLTKGEIMSIIALKPEPFPSADYLDELAQFEPPESIAEKRRQHEEDAAYFGDRDEKYEAFRQKVIRGLKEDGYYEVDEDYIAAREKSNQYAIKNARIPFSFLDPADLEGMFATPEDHQRRLREGCYRYRPYVPDEEDALLISYGDDDYSMSDDSGSDEEDAGPPVDAN
uniref:Uncharacterized protein n=1 Tax=Avena sativa TaxID=4498 RepID=A0ACD5W949_AVESA